MDKDGNVTYRVIGINKGTNPTHNIGILLNTKENKHFFKPVINNALQKIVEND